MKLTNRIWALLAIVLLFAMLVTPLQAASTGTDDPTSAARNDNKMDPLTLKQQELKQQGIEAKLEGKAKGPTHEVAKGQYVQLELEGTGMVLTVMGEFSDFPHNHIAQPDRTVDNTTLWVPDFSTAHMDGLLYDQTPGANSMANFYLEQSSGRYTVAGEATDWIPVPHTAAYYDDNKGVDTDPNADTSEDVWLFLADTVNGWYSSQIAAGKTPAEIDAYLSGFDKRDRYDYDGDGNFNEPDGYIDTFQSVHSGEGEEAGGGALGTVAIWSHSWYAHHELEGIVGPDFNKLGGIQIGNSNFWVGKYTIQPENGGVGVFTHEFGHDLGLPDLYDTSGGENGTGFWTLMSSGSWMGDGTIDIGSKSSHMGAWEKFQLGWLNYEVAYAGEKSEHKLAPMEFNTKQAQAVLVVLPKKTVDGKLYSHYYVAEYRTYKGYDSTLKVGPYFFGYLNNPDLANFVDHFPYQDGLLIHYWDTSQKNNQTRRHPGAGLLLPIDAHYKALYRVDGGVWRNRIQTYDSTFTLDQTDALNNLHVNSVLSPVPSLPAVEVFDDRTLYYDPANPQGSVKNPNTGTQIRIQSISAQDSFMQIEVRPAK